MIRFSRFMKGDAHVLLAAQGFSRAAADRLEASAGDGAASAWTMVSDGVPAAVGGISHLWPGVAELWSFRVPAFTRAEGVAFARFCRRTADALDVRRLQATARADDPVAVAFLAFLGMKPEGVLRAFDPDGGDHLICARVRAAPGAR